MVLVSTDMVLYTMCNKVHELPSKFMCLLNSQVDTTNAHGERERCYTNLYKDILNSNCNPTNITYENAKNKCKKHSCMNPLWNILTVYLSITTTIGVIGV